MYGGKKGRDGVLRGETEMDQVSFALVLRFFTCVLMLSLHDNMLD